MHYIFMEEIPYMLWDKMHEDLRSKNHFGLNSEVGGAAKGAMDAINSIIIYEKHGVEITAASQFSCRMKCGGL